MISRGWGQDHISIVCGPRTDWGREARQLDHVLLLYVDTYRLQTDVALLWLMQFVTVIRNRQLVIVQCNSSDHADNSQFEL